MRISWPRILARHADEETRDLVGAEDRIERCGFAAAAVGDRDGILAQQSGQARYVAAGDGFAERRQQARVTIRCALTGPGVRRAPRGGPASPVAGRPPRCGRACRATSENGSVEDVVQQEGGALQRRQPVQRQQQRKGEVVGQFRRRIRRKAFGIEYRLGQPRPDIDFPLRPRALQPVEAKPRHDGDEKGFGIVNVLRAGEAQIGILHARLPHRCGCRACDRRARAAARDGAPADRRQAACLMTSTLCPSTVTRRHSLA